MLQISEGKDPGAEKIELRASSTFDDLADEYLTLHAKRKKKSWRMDEYMLNRELLPLWKHSKVRDIARRDVRLVLERIADPEGRNGPIYANRVRALIHKMFNFALPNVVRLEERRAQRDLAAVTMRELLRATLRHRPDRILVGEVRGGEGTTCFKR